MSPTTFTLMSNSLDLVNNVMSKMFPAMKVVGDSFAGMIGNMNLAIEQGKADKFFEHINTFAVPMFNMAMQSAGNILQGLGNIMIAFTPLGMQLGEGMVGLTQKFADWTTGLQSSTAFQSFVSFVQTSTPIIISIIGQVWSVCTQLVTALQPMALVVLNLAQSFLSWATESGALKLVLDTVKSAGEFLLANLDSIKQIIPALVAGFIAFKGALAIGETIGKISTAIKTATTVTRGLTAVLGALNLTMLASPWFWVAVAIGAVIAAGVLLYKNWDEVKKYAQELWNKIKAMWVGIK
ncbi:hypothetical protein ACQKNO_01310 [Bacillus paramycoides]|uniref:hypothetical protein n=1 Tax=Bacillus paramycoides TaxID=2026194 RepID=UPI003D059D1B